MTIRAMSGWRRYMGPCCGVSSLRSSQTNAWPEENSPGGGIFAHFLFQHLAVKNPGRCGMFRFARHGAGIAADTDIEIDDHSIARHKSPPYSSGS